MPPNPTVPGIPSDWMTRAAQGTPYLLGIAAGDTAWVPTVALPIVTATDTHVVTANNGRAVSLLPE